MSCCTSVCVKESDDDQIAQINSDIQINNIDSSNFESKNVNINVSQSDEIINNNQELKNNTFIFVSTDSIAPENSIVDENKNSCIHEINNAESVIEPKIELSKLPTSPNLERRASINLSTTKPNVSEPIIVVMQPPSEEILTSTGKKVKQILNPKFEPADVSLEANEIAAICRCGQSKNYPRCDSSHNEYNQLTGSNFAPKMYKFKSAKTLHICACGHTSKEPVCDDSHTKLTTIQKQDIINRANAYQNKLIKPVNKSIDDESKIISDITNIDELPTPIFQHKQENTEVLNLMEKSQILTRIVRRVANPQSAPLAINLKLGEKGYFCTCGHSSVFPRCDGTHRHLNKLYNTSYAPQFVIGEDKTLYICGCGYSLNEIFCDDTHKKLSKVQKNDILKRSLNFKVAKELLIPVVKSEVSSAQDVHVSTPKVILPIAYPQALPHIFVLPKGENAFICQCGQSTDFPYCNGSHKSYNKTYGTSYAPMFVQGDDKPVEICGCGHTNKPPFCDNSHNNLSQSERDNIIDKAKVYVATKSVEVNNNLLFSPVARKTSVAAISELMQSLKTQSNILLKNPQLLPYSQNLAIGQEVFICQCGQSSDFIFCDGSHKAYNKVHVTSYGPLLVVGEGKTIDICGCGFTTSPPFCDDSHLHLNKMQKVEIIEKARLFAESKSLIDDQDAPRKPSILSPRMSIVNSDSNCTYHDININIANPHTEPHITFIKNGEKLFICQCGQSSDSYKCDGSHKSYNRLNGTSITPFLIDGNDQNISICRCGYTSTGPYCDNVCKALSLSEKATIIEKAKLYASKLNN